MEETFKSKLGFSLFFILIIGLIVGGYFWTNWTLTEKERVKQQKKEEKIEYKIDADKDYIYFVNESAISEEAEIDYKDVVINLKGQEALTETLEKENKIYKNNIVHISEMNLLSKDLIAYNYDDLYALTFRNYDVFEFGKYVSLLIKDYNYSCLDNGGVTFKDSKAYVFNVQSGELLKSNELLNMYRLNMDIVKERVTEYLSGKQTKVNNVDVIKIEDTINELKEENLYINNYGKLSITFLVKTTQTDYNEITEVN